MLSLGAMLASLAVSACEPAPSSPTRLVDLPLIETRASGPGDTLAVVYSGDGGWTGIDRGLVAGLARRGVPSVGYDSLRYFWSRRPPRQAAADLALVARHYMAAWGKSRIILAGYSFGADALPMIVADLPPDVRAHVRAIALVGAGPEGDLQVGPATWLNLAGGAGSFRIAPLLGRLKGLPIVCIYGATDRGQACARFPAELIRPVRLPGGHHFDGDFDALSRAVLRSSGL